MDQIKKNGDLVPGGDIRINGNQWLRAAFVDSKLNKVPREVQVRHAIKIITQKHRLGSVLRLSFLSLYAIKSQKGTWHCLRNGER